MFSVERESPRQEIDGFGVCLAFHQAGMLLEKELEQQLASVLARLPEQTRRVFAKSRLEGLSYQQIADQMGITPHTVKYHIRQALTLLRSEFAKYLGLFLIFLSTSLP